MLENIAFKNRNDCMLWVLPWNGASGGGRV